MSVENVEKFYGLLAEDKELREKITNAGEELKSRLKTKEDVKDKGLAEGFALLEPFAREAGCPFTLEDLQSYQEGKERSLTDEELDAVAGGDFGGGCFLLGFPADGEQGWCALYGVIDGHRRKGAVCIVVGG
jgi:hypothetical protein